MCGIAGFVGPGNNNYLRNMMDALSHRGPDAFGEWHDPDAGVHLGHQRLSVIDLQYGSQPMVMADGSLVIIYNGEIYNHSELRKELEATGHHFRTDHSDTEVLIHGYKEWGQDIQQKLNGMWAFVIYDRSNNELFLSRDRFGEKPLFYTQQNGVFVFASELKALLKHRNINSNLSRLSLQKYYAYGYIPSPSSLYENIYKLPSGSGMTVSLSSLKHSIKRYWHFTLNPLTKIPKKPEEEWGEHIRFLLHQSVKRRLTSDVPIGVFLSGGIDSSAIAAYAAKEMESSLLTSFSIGFEDESFDESRWSRSIAKKLNTEHYLEQFSIQALMDSLPEIISKMDEPIGDSSLIPTFLLSKVARKKVKVALGGDGADELFGGYDPFHALRLASIYSRCIPKPAHKAILLLAAQLPTANKNISFDFMLKKTLRGLSHPAKIWNAIWMGPLGPDELSDLFSEKIDVETVYSEAIEIWDSCSQSNLVDKTLQFYTQLYLQNNILVKVDRASMMNSLEVRSPFLDVDLVEFVSRIPHNYKYRNCRTKYILKKAMEPVLPNEIIYRRKKGFGSPIGKWFKEKTLNIDPKSASTTNESNFLSKKYNEHLNGNADNRLFLWSHWLLKQSIPS
jgi:asparagine synthase (glutamine-hydrolysing)